MALSTDAGNIQNEDNAASESALLQVQGLTVSVNKDGNLYKIIDNIDFAINEGEIAGLAGESGCGKSMTALSIPNLLPYGVSITEGKILYKNTNLCSLTEKEIRGVRGSEISVIFQDVRQSLNPLMRIGSQITETLVLGGSKNKAANKKTALDMLDSLGFDKPEKIFNGFAHQMSGGMCQRIMTAIAVIRRPKLLLADEPSSSLDEESQERCLSLLREMNVKNKMSLLIISHDLSIIHKFSNRYFVMYSGKIMEEGPSDGLFSPLHPYTQALIKAMPHKDKKGNALENIPGRIPSVEDKETITGCPFAPRCGKAKDICRQVFPQAKIMGGRKVYCYFPGDA